MEGFPESISPCYTHGPFCFDLIMTHPPPARERDERMHNSGIHTRWYNEQRSNQQVSEQVSKQWASRERRAARYNDATDQINPTQSIKPTNQSINQSSLSLSQSKREGGRIEGEEQNTAFSSTSSSSTRIEGGG
jgi:hypothetical protein